MSKKYKQDFEIGVFRDSYEKFCLSLKRVVKKHKRSASGPVLFSEARIPLRRVRNNGHFNYEGNLEEIRGVGELTCYEIEAINQIMSKLDVQNYISRRIQGTKNADESFKPLEVEVEIESTNKFFANSSSYRSPREAVNLKSKRGTKDNELGSEFLSKF